MEDPTLAHAVRLACKFDFLFFVRAYGWLLEPREVDGERMIPFLAWPKQEEILWKVDDAFGRKNVVGSKSRDVGFTWMTLFKFFHAFEFMENVHTGLISRDEKAVDERDNPDSLLPKIDLIYESLPSYLKAEVDRTKGKMVNRWTGATITSEAATINAFRGGRKLAILSDETAYLPPNVDSEVIASMGHVTKSLFMISSLNGTHCQFEKIRQECMKSKNPPRVVLRMNWKDVPSRRKNMYTSENGRLIKIDPEFDLPADYPFLLDGLVRSPYYDEEWRKANGNRRTIAKDLDEDAGAMSDCFFDEETIKELIDRNCIEAVRRCLMLVDDDGDWILQDNASGPLSIWCPINQNSLPPLSRYAIGCDISNGTATSLTNNSVAHIIDIRTGEQVAEYVSNYERPEMFARKVHALARMFYDATINWESNAVASAFKTTLMKELGYSNVWIHRDTSKRYEKRTEKPGWHNGTAGLEILFSSWVTPVYTSKHILRSSESMREMMNYIYKNGRVEYAEGLQDSQADAGQAHGDRVVAAALAWMVAAATPWGNDHDRNLASDIKVQQVMESRRSRVIEMTKPRSFLVFS